MTDLTIDERLGSGKVRRGFEFWSNNLSTQFISHSSGFIFSYLEIIPSKKDTIKRVVIKVWNLWFVITSKVLRFALEMISCTTCAEMIRVASAWHLFRKSMKYELWSFEVLNRSFNQSTWTLNVDISIYFTNSLKFTFQKNIYLWK